MRILSVILIALVVVSCQRQPDSSLPPNSNTGNNNNGNNNNPPSSDSTVLWKYIEIDTTLASGSDTVDKTIFFYDDMKRLDHYYAYDFSVPGDFDTTIVSYYYQNNDTLPYKITSIYHETDLDLDTDYYAYNNGIVAWDSSLHHTTWILYGSPVEKETAIVRTYQDHGNTTTVSEAVYYILPAGSPCHSTYEVSKTYVSGNIAGEQYVNPGCLGGSISSQWQYDNKVNPFYLIDLHYPVHKTFYGNGLTSQKNNATQEISSSNNNVPVNFIYTYRSDNYPLIVRTVDPTNPSYNLKGLFFYTK